MKWLSTSYENDSEIRADLRVAEAIEVLASSDLEGRRQETNLLSK